MNVFWLPQVADQSPHHNLPCHWVPYTCAVRAAWFGKYFCQSAIVKCHHSVRNPQKPAFRIAICSKCTCVRISGLGPAYRHIAAGVKSSKSLGIGTGRLHESIMVTSTATTQLCSEPTPVSGLAT